MTRKTVGRKYFYFEKVGGNKNEIRRKFKFNYKRK